MHLSFTALKMEHCWIGRNGAKKLLKVIATVGKYDKDLLEMFELCNSKQSLQ